MALPGMRLAVTSTVSSLIDVCERILKGQEVDLTSIEALHQAVLRGDIITQVHQWVVWLRLVGGHAGTCLPAG